MNNIVIVTRLLNEFHVNHAIHDPLTGENLLHAVFKVSSNLRFYFVLEYPGLLQQSDNKGKLPLFLACEQNDITFFKWLFREAKKVIPTIAIKSATSHGIPAEEHSKQRRVRLSQVYGEFSIDVNFDTGMDIPTSPHIAEVVNMKPFSTSTAGSSILHILAERGCIEILSIIMRISDHVHGFDFSALSIRRSKHLPLPIEKALTAKNLDCTKVLIDLAISTYQLPYLLEDKNILKVAAVSKSIDNIKTMISFGFHAGIELAITLAATYRLHKIVRMLLFWSVEVQSYFEFSHSRGSCQFFSASKLTWRQFELQYMDPCWLLDAVNAVNTAAKTLTELTVSHSFKENSLVIFQELGEKCIEYFEGDNSVMCTLPPLITDSDDCTKIVSIKLSENHLETVPYELFQLVSLKHLDLKYNEIKSLPTSKDHLSKFYSAKLESLCIDCNELTCLPDDMIWGLANSLESLSVQNNKLVDIPPGLWLMPNLATVKFANNRLSSLHYLSKPYFFQNEELVDKISSFEILSDGSLKPPENISDDEAESLINHIRCLLSLYHTISIFKYPNEELSDQYLLNEVIQLYQSRVYFRGIGDTNEMLFTPMTSPDSPTFTLAHTLNEAVFDSKMTFLDVSHNSFRVFPWDLPCLAPNLVKLDMASNSINAMDIVLDLPKKIGSVSLQFNKIASLRKQRLTGLPCGCPVGLLSVNKNRQSLTNYCKHSQHEILEKLSRLILDNNCLEFFPVLKELRPDHLLSLEYSSNYHIQANSLFPDMAILSLASNQFINVPQHIHHLKHLSSLNLSHNNIQELPEEMGLISTDYITFIKLDGVKPKNVPGYILKSSSRKLVKYLKDLKQRYESCLIILWLYNG